MSKTRDPICCYMENILNSLPSTPPSQPSIFIVNDDLRCGNEKHYDPKIISIGPLHHGKDHLKAMEQHKLRYLKLLLDRNPEATIDTYVTAIKSLEEKTRSCYAELNDKFKSSDNFVQMLLLDGCFIIECIRKFGIPEMREEDDPIFQSAQVGGLVRNDMMLVENQVPFFILEELFTMARTTTDPEHDLGDFIRFFIGDLSSLRPFTMVIDNISLEHVDHILSFAHKVWCSSFIKTTPAFNTDIENVLFINYYATELEEFGIRFEKDTQNHWLDIKFDKGVLKIPEFTVTDRTETILRNLIALEQRFPDKHQTYVTDYTFVMMCLINSSKDVKVLRRSKIISNFLGDDEIVYRLFSGLGKNLFVSVDVCYREEFDKIKEHRRHRKNRWMAILKRNYFNSPWAYIAFAASLMLMILTLIQTLFSILPYRKSY